MFRPTLLLSRHSGSHLNEVCNERLYDPTLSLSYKQVSSTTVLSAIWGIVTSTGIRFVCAAAFRPAYTGERASTCGAMRPTVILLPRHVQVVEFIYGKVLETAFVCMKRSGGDPVKTVRGRGYHGLFYFYRSKQTRQSLMQQRKPL